MSYSTAVPYLYIMNRSISVGKIETTLTHFMSPVGLLIDEVKIQGGPVFVNSDQLHLSKGEFEFIAKVRAKSIEVFLEELSPAGLHTFQVTVTEQGLEMNAIKTVIVPIPAKALAVLKMDSEDALSVDLISAEAMGAGLKNLVATKLAELNPIVTADIFPVPVEFLEVRHTGGEVLIIGKAVLTGEA
ncbi:MAG: hypothetical protein ACK53G_10935 [Armatimonadota bacterium]